MTRSKQLLANFCFILLFLFGGVMAVYGFYVVPSRPFFLLDVVLTPEELADVRKREETLAMLEKIPTNGRPAIISGVAVMALAALGSWATTVTETTADGRS